MSELEQEKYDFQSFIDSLSNIVLEGLESEEVKEIISDELFWGGEVVTVDLVEEESW